MSEILSHRFWTEMGTKVVAGALQSAWDILKVVILFLVARLILNKVLDGVSGSLIRREEGVSEGKAARIKTLGSLLKSIGNYVLIFIAGVMLLRAFKVDPVPILTTAGVAGLAVGFGAQRLVRDVITGFFILLENQFSVGDYVTIGGGLRPSGHHQQRRYRPGDQSFPRPGPDHHRFRGPCRCRPEPHQIPYRRQNRS